MSHREFLDLHASSEKLMQSYFVEVKKSSSMLAECTSRPMPLKRRLMLASQGVVEHTAHLTYLSAKSLLLSAARLGYGFSH
jgi:hypothetical protein